MTQSEYQHIKLAIQVAKEQPKKVKSFNELLLLLGIKQEDIDAVKVLENKD